MADQPLKLTRREAAQHLDVSVDTVDNMAKRGEIERIGAGKAVRFVVPHHGRRRAESDVPATALLDVLRGEQQALRAEQDNHATTAQTLQLAVRQVERLLGLIPIRE